jgi:hypothetical protein
VREQDQQGSQDELSEVPLATVKPLLQGSMSSEPTGDGFIPVRLPESAWTRVPNLWAREMYRMAAGVRLNFVTTASSFQPDVRASVMAIAGGLLPDPRDPGGVGNLDQCLHFGSPQRNSARSDQRPIEKKRQVACRR